MNTRVEHITENGVHLKGGEVVFANRVVIAAPDSVALRLRGEKSVARSTSVECFYYAAEQSPVQGPWLVLNGDGTGPINNLCVPSEVHATYAPPDQALISVTVLGDATESAVRAQLREWYGDAAAQWRHLQTDSIPQALPFQQPPALTPVEKPVKLSDRLFVCGDHTDIASIEGAIKSGVRAAQAISEAAL